MNDIPRNSGGWPTVEPKFFTLQQLVDEAQSWIGCANNSANTVGAKQWTLYTTELIQRSFMSSLHEEHWRETRVAPKVQDLLTKQSNGFGGRGCRQKLVWPNLL